MKCFNCPLQVNYSYEMNEKRMDHLTEDQNLLSDETEETRVLL